MSNVEDRIRRRWNAWLKTPGNAEHVVLLMRAGDNEAFKQLFEFVVIDDHRWRVELVEGKLVEEWDCSDLTAGAGLIAGTATGEARSAPPESSQR